MPRLFSRSQDLVIDFDHGSFSSRPDSEEVALALGGKLLVSLPRLVVVLSSIENALYTATGV